MAKSKVSRLAVYQNRHAEDSLKRLAARVRRGEAEGIDGWAFVGFYRYPDRTVVMSDYSVNSPLDVFGLPELARQRISEEISRSSDDD